MLCRSVNEKKSHIYHITFTEPGEWDIFLVKWATPYTLCPLFQVTFTQNKFKCQCCTFIYFIKSAVIVVCISPCIVYCIVWTNRFLLVIVPTVQIQYEIQLGSLKSDRSPPFLRFQVIKYQSTTKNTIKIFSFSAVAAVFCCQTHYNKITLTHRKLRPWKRRGEKRLWI